MRQVAQSFSLFTMTVSASFATWNSAYSTPFCSQAAFSSSSIGRDAFEMSVSPAQKRSKPPPVPETPTVICTPEFSCWKRSAARVVNGPTVLEPSAWMRPERLSDPPPVAPAPDSSSSPPHAAAANASSEREDDHHCDACGFRVSWSSGRSVPATLAAMGCGMVNEWCGTG